MHGTGPVSPWIERWSHLLRPGDRVLDVACGAGRHTRWFAQRGCHVTAIDRDREALTGLEACARVICADIEGQPWPLGAEEFDAVVVTHYLWRPLLPTLLDRLATGGVLLYETFALGHARFGRPSRDAFLLQPGELMQVCRDLHILGFEDGLSDDPPRRLQRVAAWKPGHADPHRVGDRGLDAAGERSAAR